MILKPLYPNTKHPLVSYQSIFSIKVEKSIPSISEPYQGWTVSLYTTDTEFVPYGQTDVYQMEFF